MNLGTTSDLSSQSPRSQDTRSASGPLGYGPVDQTNTPQGWLATADPRVGRRPSSTQSPYSFPPTPSPAGTDLVLVSARNTRTEVSEVGSSAGALTRVMSPNNPTEPSNLMMYEPNQQLLLGVQCNCPVCHVWTTDPAICASCGAYGHPICIGIEPFQGYAFCHSCMSQVASQYAAMSNAHHRREWQISLSNQLVAWRDRARDALGASTSIGITVGGAAATAAGAAIAVATGFVQGAAGAAAGSGVQALPPPPGPDDSASRPLALRRSNSTGDLAQNLEPCPKCDLGVQRARHTYRGSCRGFPSSFYFGARGPRAVTDVSPAQGDTSPQVPQRAEITLVPTESRDTRPEIPPISTELARRTGETIPASSVFTTPERALEDLLHPVPITAPLALGPAGTQPGSPEGVQLPPSTFDSANSNVQPSFQGSRPEVLLDASESGARERSDPASQSPEPPPPVFTFAELTDQISNLARSNEELSRAVKELQDSVNNLEIQVADLQFQLQWQETGPESEALQQYNISTGTPRLQTDPPIQDALSDWYGDGSRVVPPRITDLTASSEPVQLGPSTNQQGDAAETGLTGNALYQLSVQSPYIPPRTDGASGGIGANAVNGDQRVTEVLGGSPLGVRLQTDSDVFSFLAGTQPTCPPAPAATARVDTSSSALPSLSQQQQVGCPAPTIPTGNVGAAVPPGLGVVDPSLQAPTQAELGMIMKAIQTFLKELPKLELGDIATRATRLISWKANIEQTLAPVGFHVRSWWRWCVKQATDTHRRFQVATLQDRESIVPLDRMPIVWEQIDSWMKPKILGVLPSVIRDNVSTRSRQGQFDETHIVLFWVLKQFGPGGADEQIALNENILNPHVCTNPRSAQAELIRWKENVKRLAELGISPPAILLSFRAMTSIFSTVFEKAEPQLHARWIALNNQLGLPHRVTFNSLTVVAAFAEAELGALALAGNSSLNPGLPLTDNQKHRQSQMKDSEKKRAAAVKLEQQQRQQLQDQQKQLQKQLQQQSDQAAAATAPPRDFKKSATTAMWANPCNNWTNNGTCHRGIACLFRHEGFPTTEKRCITCGKKDHLNKDCTAPGGVKDPKREESWKEYRERKEKHAPAKGAGKGKPNPNKDKGEPSPKPKPKAKGKSTARAVRDLEGGDGELRVSASRTNSFFPTDSIGLDSWANVHMIHKKPHKGTKFNDKLTLAHGTCACHRDVGPKGVPRVTVPRDPNGENIDLFPEGFLWERGCEIRRGDQHVLITPTGRSVEVSMWGTLPYISKAALHAVIRDLPEHSTPGRSGKTVQTPTAARVCSTVSMSETRSQLKHLSADMSKAQLNHTCSKYKQLPDAYYGGDAEHFVTPDRLEKHLDEASDKDDRPLTVKLWEWYSGSSSLTKKAKTDGISHHPPIDYRYGWNLSKVAHQLQLLYTLIKFGTDCLFASPNCAPWGNDSRAVSEVLRVERRASETSTLQFLTVACIFQFLLGRKYIIENSAYSDIFDKSALAGLRDLPHFLALYDHCSAGPNEDGEFVRKRIHFQSNQVLHHLQKLCPGGHVHTHLRGKGRAASAALYPDAECTLILQDAKLPLSMTDKGGRISLTDGAVENIDLIEELQIASWTDSIQMLYSVAKSKNAIQVWNKYVQPWLDSNCDGEWALPASLNSNYEAAVPMPDIVRSERPIAAPVRAEIEQPPEAGEQHTKTVKDLVTPFDKDMAPWQSKKYSAESALWQGAALRRRAHPRRSNVSLGVCSVDLSGPHEPTPRPGLHTSRNPCHYFLVLTVRPDQTADMCDAATQCDTEAQPPDDAPSGELAVHKSKPALVYAALLGTKDEAPEAVKRLLAQVNNDHANFPTEIIFRVHSDQGREFISKEFQKFLVDKGILPTTTAGYDPNNNPAEAFVGILKRRARYLLGGTRLPTNWWGMATLAAAQLCRADAGLEEYPKIPFGTRVMIVRDPPHANAFMPRAEPATIFGPCEHVSGANWVYQHGRTKPRTNIQPQGMNEDDLNWIKVNMSNWDAPDAPLELPPSELYDATALVPVAPVPNGASRESATCPACICIRRKHRVTTPHTLVWGECLRATPPPPPVEGPLLEVQPEAEVADGQPVASAARLFASKSKLLEHPHACVALSDVATWGSLSSVDTFTDVPSTADELSDLSNVAEEEDEFDDDYVVHGGNDQGVPQPFEEESPEPAPTNEAAEDECQDADAEEDIPKPKKRRHGRKKRWLRNILRLNPQLDSLAAKVVGDDNPHAELIDKEAMQQVIKEEGKVIVPAAQVRNSVGPILERWKLAAEGELTKNFLNTAAFHESTPDEIKQHGRPLPMLCVWSRQESEDYYKCRACVCGNFAKVDPTQQSWTAQAEPSSLIASLKLGRTKRWQVSKHDVKGAFLNASLPEGRLVIVSPPEQWVRWGIVPAGTLWTLEKAVYGLRESPALWSAERDSRLRQLEWTVGGITYFLRCCPSDSQVWMITKKGDSSNTVHGILVVYVDDFLLQSEAGPVRDGFLSALSAVWTLDKESTLEPGKPFTFLGIEMIMQTNGDILLHQRAFVDSLLDKYGLSRLKGNASVQIDKLPQEAIPSPAELKKLQTHSGEFNWLATRTRVDLSYYTSLLASALSKHKDWSLELAQKILRYLSSTRDQGITISCAGSLTDLVVWSDAGFAGSDTRSQSGVVIAWGGSIITWRSSRQTVSALSTAEAELNAAALAWQIVEGVRRLIGDLGIRIDSVRILIDNKAALTIAECGATWRTRYFSVRGHRLHEEHSSGRALLEHCKTEHMLADALTKLASSSVIGVLRNAMNGSFPFPSTAA